MEEREPEIVEENQPPEEPAQPVDAPPAAPQPTPGEPQVQPGAVPETTVADNAQYTPAVTDLGSVAKVATSQPTVGRIVHYTLTRKDAEHANRRRTTSKSIADRMNAGTWSTGAQAHIGNPVSEGQVVAMVVVGVCFPGDDQGRVNGQAFLDGNDVLWVTSAPQGSAPGEPGTWAWLPRG